MKIISNIAEIRAWRQTVQAAGPIPFVPTMGALHEGHASLVRQARQLAGNTGTVISSIFVNPTQFGPNEDFKKYPRTLDADLQILEAAGCDAVFTPSADDMYAQAPGISIDPGALGDILEGAIRPGHFRGVCTVVDKLLNITQPTHLLLGQKDFQQQAVLRRMCRDLNVPAEVVTCATVREADGLAMSSRNRYLGPEDRPRAAVIFETLRWADEQYAKGERRVDVLENGMKTRIDGRGLAVQYAVLAHPETLEAWRGTIEGPAVALVAAKLGATRLIDNLILQRR